MNHSSRSQSPLTTIANFTLILVICLGLAFAGLYIGAKAYKADDVAAQRPINHTSAPQN